jgi:hypothetical protein
MNRIKIGLSFVLMATLVTMAAAQQALDPAFQVSSVNGECKISLPGQDEFLPVEESKAYPYGSHIRTGSRSSMVMTISEGNVVRVLANADLVFNEDSSNVKIKNVQLNDGEVEFELNKAFHDGGNALNVETATAICGAIGSHARVASRMEQNLRIVIFRVIKGLIRVYGEDFEVGEMKADEWLSLLSPSDRAFLRLKTMKGAFNIRIKDQDMNDKNLATKEGTVLKIWRRVIPETNQRVITFQLTSPEGELLDTFTVTFGADQKANFGGVEWKDKLPKDDGKGRQRGNPIPPEDVLDAIIQAVLDDINIEFNRNRPRRPRPPKPQTPTKVGDR